MNHGARSIQSEKKDKPLECAKGVLKKDVVIHQIQVRRCVGSISISANMALTEAEVLSVHLLNEFDVSQCPSLNTPFACYGGLK